MGKSSLDLMYICWFAFYISVCAFFKIYVVIIALEFSELVLKYVLWSWRESLFYASIVNQIQHKYMYLEKSVGKIRKKKKKIYPYLKELNICKRFFIQIDVEKFLIEDIWKKYIFMFFSHDILNFQMFYTIFPFFNLIYIS